MTEKKIFFHVGLGKVASTFLQKSFFPKLKNIHYLPTNDYRHAKRILPKINAERVLVSREFDVQLEEQLRWFTAAFPEPQVIILFRRQDDWIGSQYRRFVKNGFPGSFEEFIDLEADVGFWKQQNGFYTPMLKLIEEVTHKKPFILFYDELRQHPEQFLAKLAEFLGADYPPNAISYARVHTAFSDKQLKLLRSFTRTFIRKMPSTHHNRLKNWLLFRPVWAFYHLILYAAKWIPERWAGVQPLINPESLEKVRTFYDEDWKKIQSIVSTR